MKLFCIHCSKSSKNIDLYKFSRDFEFHFSQKHFIEFYVRKAQAKKFLRKHQNSISCKNTQAATEMHKQRENIY
jgi:hypothetical protein